MKVSTPESRANQYTVPTTFEPTETLLEIKRSEFYGFVKRVESEADARAFIESLRKQFHDARHVCSAFVIGADRDIQRSSDDGEPAGTAGIPMLQALLSRRTSLFSNAEADLADETTDLSDVCAVVVRYFGGIKLGAGGLVRAYTDAVVQTLDAATLCSRQRLRLGAVALPHAEAGKFENNVRALGYTVLGTEYESTHATVQLGVFDAQDQQNQAQEHVAELTAGQGNIEWSGTEWVDIPLS